MASAYTYIAPTGVIVPDTETIRTGVQQEYLDAFGDDLNIAPNTPQGILIDLETLGRTAVAENNAALANQINPDLAGGIFVDALLSLTGARRLDATHSTVACTITGVAATIIPQGAQISDASGNMYECFITVTIPFSGSMTGVIFQSVLEGAIPGLAGTLTTIVSNILGWETVTNPSAASPGVPPQSDVAAKSMRRDTLAEQGMGLAQAIKSGLYQIGVPSLTFRENIDSTPETIDEIDMVANSLYACIDPGTVAFQTIADTITRKKNGGCAYNNGLGIHQSVPVTDPFSGQTLDVLFDTPSIVTIAIKVTVHEFTSVLNIDQAVKDAVLAYAAGQIASEPGFVVGGSVSPFQIAGAINIRVPGLFVEKVEIAVYSFTQRGTITNTTPDVTALTYNAPISPFVGITTSMKVTGDNIPAATTVTAIVGATGVTISNSATATATEILTFAPASLSFQTTEIPIGVWQQALTSSPFITVIPV